MSGIVLPGPRYILDSAPPAWRRCPELGCGSAHGHAGAHVPEAVPLPAPPLLTREERTTDAPPRRYGTSRVCPRGGCAHEPGAACSCECHAVDVAELDAAARELADAVDHVEMLWHFGGPGPDAHARLDTSRRRLRAVLAGGRPAAALATLARDYLAAEDAERAAIGEAPEHDRDPTGPALDALATTTERARGRLLDVLGVA